MQYWTILFLLIKDACNVFYVESHMVAVQGERHRAVDDSIFQAEVN